MATHSVATTVQRITVDEFLTMDFPPEQGKAELLDGEVVFNLGNARFVHEFHKNRLMLSLAAYVLAHPEWWLMAETMCVLRPESSVVPDLAIVRCERLHTFDWSGRFAGAPDIAIEIVSSESAAALEDKVSLYLRMGSKVVWLLFPTQRLVRIIRPNDQIENLREPATLGDEELLPGLAIPVASLFDL